MKSPIFVYGTLSHPTIVKTLLGRTTVEVFPRAKIFGCTRHPVKEQVFPGMIPSDQPSAVVDGFLLESVSDLELTLLDWFEGDEYDRKVVQVRQFGTGGENDSTTAVEAQAYIWKPHLMHDLHLDQEWSYERFCRDHLEWYLEHTVGPCRREMERLGLTKT